MQSHKHTTAFISSEIKWAPYKFIFIFFFSLSISIQFQCKWIYFKRQCCAKCLVVLNKSNSLWNLIWFIFYWIYHDLYSGWIRTESKIKTTEWHGCTTSVQWSFGSWLIGQIMVTVMNIFITQFCRLLMSIFQLFIYDNLFSFLRIRFDHDRYDFGDFFHFLSRIFLLSNS